MERALGKLAISTPDGIKTVLRLAFESPRDESRMRNAFLALKQGKMSMRDYVQKALHLFS